MKSIRRRPSTTLIMTVGLCAASQASAQNATVDLNSQKQYIRGYGGMVHVPWAGDLNAAERTLAFGNGEGQLGFTILRIPVPDNSTSDSSAVATAKAAIEAGGIVYASPWNGAGNMDSSQFSSYASHLSGFVSYMKDQGVDLYAISAQNEPDYGAQSGWKAWTASQCHDFVLNYGDQMGTRLMSCESFNYNKSFYDPILNDPAALANMGVLGTHLYGTPVNGYSYPLFDQKGEGKERWMTEHYTDSNTDANSWPNALNVATELHHSMVEGQFNAYTWWYIKRSYGPINNGSVTKRGWCMAHWSKFVRPGYYRVDATSSPSNGVYLSAYKGPSDVVLVAVNTSNSSQSLSVSIQGSDISSFDKFTTSSSKSLSEESPVQASNGSLSVSLDGQSVTTLHGSGDVPTSTGGSSGSGGTGGSMGTGGSVDTGGTTPTGGSRPTGGVSATGGSSTGGRVSTGGVGTADTGGMTASGGTGGGTMPSTGGTPSSTGGTTAAGGGVGVGGAPASGGFGGAGAGLFGADSSSDEGGCSCRATGGRSSTSMLSAWGLLGLLALYSRRRRSKSECGCDGPTRGREHRSVCQPQRSR